MSKMKLGQLLGEYFDSTTIHGFSYIHGREHWASRMLWVVLTFCGFMTAGVMINQAFMQWSDNPVITTLETISAPIDEIQFPTVTVCDQKPADNWGSIEKVLNSLAFQCSNQTPYCKESTKEIRKDFEFLIASFLKECMKLLKGIKYNILKEALMFKADISYYNRTGIIDIVAEVLRQGKDEELIDLAIQKFSVGYVPFPLEKEIDTLFGAKYTPDTFLNCTSTVCRNYQENAVRFLLMLKNTRKEGIPFGSFITKFIYLKKFKSFGSCRPDLCDATYQSINCKNMDENEKKLHEYFAILSKSFGFNESELLSLYELPGMLADDLNYAELSVDFDGNQLGDADNLLGDMPQAYLYSTCKERENIYPYFTYGSSFQRCEWHEEKLNETACSDESLEDIWKSNYDDYVYDESLIEPCCTHRWTDKMGHNLKAIMKVMRFAIRRGKTLFHLRSLISNKTISEKLLKYPFDIDQKYSAYKQRVLQYDTTSMIPWCTLNNGTKMKSWRQSEKEKVEPCNLFQPVITNNGICHSFNPESLQSMLKSSYFLESFKDSFNDDLFEEEVWHNGTGLGPKHALNFILVGTSMQRKNVHSPLDATIGLTSRSEYFDIESVQQTVEPGYHTVYKVQVMKIMPSPDLDSIETERRGCRLETETQNLTLFKKYSQSACKLEIQIQHARAYCNCVPWYLPNEGNGRYTICDKRGNHCFKKKMNDVNISKETCPPSCEQIRFITSEIHKKIDPVKECEKGEVAESFIANYYHMNLNSRSKTYDGLPKNVPIFDYIQKPAMLQFFDKMQEYKESHENISLEVKGNNYVDILASIQETCKALLSKDVARVSIMFESNYYVLTKTNVRVTFFDKISALGGSLGLFTGVSILSMVEICFWILKGLIRLKDMFPIAKPNGNLSRNSSVV